MPNAQETLDAALVYNQDGIRLYHGDAIVILAALKEAGERPDLLLNDPPYSAAVHDNMQGLGYMRLARPLMDAMLEFQRDCVKEGRGIYFSDGYLIQSWSKAARRHAPLEYKRHAVWVKTLPNNRFTRKLGVPVCSHETINLIASKECVSMWHQPHPSVHYGLGNGSIWTSRAAGQHGHKLGALQRKMAVDQNGKPLNQGRKPIGLIISLVSQFSDEGDLIIDPTVGLGTTLIAAKVMGRRAIGIEMDAVQVAADIQMLTNLNPVMRYPEVMRKECAPDNGEYNQMILPGFDDHLPDLEEDEKDSD